MNTFEAWTSYLLFWGINYSNFASLNNNPFNWFFVIEKPKGYCNREQAFAEKANDVGFAGKCPFPSSKKDSTCCCGDDCCWDKCTLENPPDDCLVGMYNGEWLYDSKKGYYRAVKNFEGSGTKLLLYYSEKNKRLLLGFI